PRIKKKTLRPPPIIGVGFSRVNRTTFGLILLLRWIETNDRIASCLKVHLDSLCDIQDYNILPQSCWSGRPSRSRESLAVLSRTCAGPAESAVFEIGRAHV